MCSYFLGYTSSHKSYLLYDMENKKTLTSNMLSFFPDILPYSSSASIPLDSMPPYAPLSNSQPDIVVSGHVTSNSQLANIVQS